MKGQTTFKGSGIWDLGFRIVLRLESDCMHGSIIIEKGHGVIIIFEQLINSPPEEIRDITGGV